MAENCFAILPVYIPFLIYYHIIVYSIDKIQENCPSKGYLWLYNGTDNIIFRVIL
jgi:hypothetical protein